MPKRYKAQAKQLEELKKDGVPVGLTTRSAAVVPSSFDAENKTVRFVATTEQPAMVWDWDRWDFVNEVLFVGGMELPENGRVPLLDTHNRSTIKNVLGSAADFRNCETCGYAGKDCEVSFSGVRDGQDAAQKVEEGHVTDVSVGYEVLEAYWVPDGEQQIIGGREFEGPLKVSTKWKLKELSLAPIGADSLAKVRAAGYQFSEDADMWKKLRNFLEQRGLSAEATDAEAFTFLDELAKKSAEDKAAIDKLRSEEKAAKEAEEVAKRAAEKARQEERQRISEIRDAVRVAGLDDAVADELVNGGVSMDAARAKIFEKMKAKNQPLGSGTARSELGLDERDKYRAAAVDGLLLRSGVVIEKPVAGAREFRGRTLLDIARECLEAGGVNTRGLLRREIASRAIAPSGSSDFPILMSQLAGRRLLAAYNEAPATWRPFVSLTDATDFKDIYGIKLSEAPDLEGMDEHGEYKSAFFDENQEKYRLVTKGKIAWLTRVMIINDDLRAFNRIPMLFGNAARRMESDAVYSLIIGNPVMNDGKALFHVDHKNLEAVAENKAPVNADNLDAARQAMRKQKGMKGTTIDVIPAFLLVPVAQELSSDVLLRSTALPKENMSSGTYNPWANRLTPIADPRLDAASTKAWYLLADPAQVPTIEVAYLEGEQQPYIDEQVDFKSDALGIKCRHDFGAGAMDTVGVFKNPGE